MPEQPASTTGPVAGDKPAPVAPTAEAPVSTGPKAGKVVAVGAKRVPAAVSESSSKADGPSAEASSSGAVEALKTSSPADAAPSNQEKPSSGSEPAADKPATETEAKPGAAVRAMAIALEKEAQLVADRKALSDERKAFEAERDAAVADAKVTREARALAAQGQRLKALELLGIDLDAVQDEYLAGVREPTAQEVIDQRVRETIAAERKAEAEAAARRAEEDAAKQTNELNSRIDFWKNEAEAQFKAGADKFDPAAFDGVTADLIWDRAVRAFDETGKLPTQAETLQLIQDDFDRRLAKSRKFKPATAPATETGQDKTAPQARDTTPRPLTSRDAGDVPLKAKPPKRKTTAFERLEEAKRELGVN